LVKSINNSLDQSERLEQDKVRISFDKWWDELNNALKKTMSEHVQEEVENPLDTVPPLDLYTCCGLKKPTSKSSIFQDFKIDRDGVNPNPVYYMWADNFKSSTINAEIVNEPEPSLRISFDHTKDSWGCNIALRPYNDTGIIAENSYLCFESRLIKATNYGTNLDNVAISLRLTDRRLTHWEYALPPNDYRPTKHHQILVDKYDWKQYYINLRSKDWQLFKMDGNYLYASKKPDFSVIATMVLSFGAYNPEFRPGPGKGIVEIKNFIFKENVME
jgi:hypothetical protein